MLYTDGTLSGYDQTIQDATKQNSDLNALILSYQNDFIPWAKQAAAYARAGNGPNYVIIYNKMQDWNAAHLSQPAAYIQTGPTQPDAATGAAFDKIAADAAGMVKTLQDEVNTNNGIIKQATTDRLAYWNSLPDTVKTSINNESAADLTNAQTELAKQQIASDESNLANEKSKIIFYVGLGMGLILLGAIVYFAFFHKTTPKPE